MDPNGTDGRTAPVHNTTPWEGRITMSRAMSQLIDSPKNKHLLTEFLLLIIARFPAHRDLALLSLSSLGDAPVPFFDRNRLRVSWRHGHHLSASDA